MLHNKNDNSAFLTFGGIFFDIDYALISCLLCKLNTLWNIFMILVRNVEQDETTYHIHE